MVKQSGQNRCVLRSLFKAQSLSLLDPVNKTKMPLRVTRWGRRLPTLFLRRSNRWANAGQGRWRRALKRRGDILSPVIDLEDFQALKD